VTGRSVMGRAWRRATGAVRTVFRTAKGVAIAGAAAVVGVLLFDGGGDVSTLGAFLGFAGLAALMSAPIIAATGLLLKIRSKATEGRIAWGERGLMLHAEGSEPRLLGRSFSSGVVVPHEDGFEVRLVRDTGDDVSVLVDDDATARALLSLARVGREWVTTRVEWASWVTRALSGGLTFAAVGLSGFLTAIFLPEPFNLAALVVCLLLPFFAAGAASRRFAWRSLEIGSDAIVFVYQGRRRMIPLRDVVDVRVLDDAVVLDLEDGSTRRFDVHGEGLAEGVRRRVASALADMGAAGGKESFFARGERSFAEWVARMRGLLDRGTGFREVRLDRDDTLRVLEDPDASPEARVGAALAVASAEPARVRVVAETCASPKLRVALEAAADGEVEEEVVAAAFEELRSATAPSE